MSATSQDLEIFRDRFLDQLSSTQVELANHREFTQYWRLVEQEAEMTKDVDKLDNWVRALARDKDRVKALETRLEGQDRENPMVASLLQIIRMVLDALEGSERKLKDRRASVRRRLAVFLLRAGPGVPKKPKPGEEVEDEATQGNKGDTKKEDQQQAALIAQKPPAPPKPQTPPEQQKKLER